MCYCLPIKKKCKCVLVKITFVPRNACVRKLSISILRGTLTLSLNFFSLMKLELRVVVLLVRQCELGL